MLLDSDIEETSQALTNHGVEFYKKFATKQAYCYFSEDQCSLQFAVANVSLRYIGYNDINLLPFS